ncbi:DUF5925 domain-containing protein [Nocardia sp. NPDC059691]|uniref:DUF5925 domain-containing protein n=1 Tax=Nocardia sp. NPDC059691 TaxID=3346908 RepID=UPI00369144AE
MSARHESLRLIGPGEPSADPAERLPWAVVVGSTYSIRDAIDALALGPFLRGDHPCARTAQLERVRPDAPLRPARGRVARTVRDNDSGAALVVGPGWSLRSVRWSGGSNRSHCAGWRVGAANRAVSHTAVRAPIG